MLISTAAVFAVLFCLVSKGYASSLDCKNAPDTETMRLRNKLLCGYDRDVRPVKDHNLGIRIDATMWLQSLTFYDFANILSIHAYMSVRWNDQYLTWNPNDYDGLDRITVSSSDIWMPDIGLLLTPITGGSSTHSADVTCRLYNNGTILCITPTVYVAPCVADVAKWPFDAHNCSARISSITSTTEMVALVFGGVEKRDYTASRDWELLDVDFHKITVSAHPTISINFTLKRHSGGATSTVVIPALVLAMLTLVGFWINPVATERMCLICLNILCHCLFLQYLGINLPVNGNEQPRILLFFRDSLLILGGSLMVSLVVRRMHGASCSPPSWAEALASCVLATLPGQVVMCGAPEDFSSSKDADDEAPFVGKTSSSRTWLVLGTLLDRVSFLVFFVILVLLLCAYVP